MKSCERELLQNARVADINCEQNEQVFSQFIGLIDDLKPGEEFSVDFNSEEQDLQFVLNGLGFATIPDPAETVLSIFVSDWMGRGNFGLGKGGTGHDILPMLARVPSVIGLQALLAGTGWAVKDDEIIVKGSTSSMQFLTAKESDLLVGLSCSNNAELEMDEWAYEWGVEELDGTKSSAKIKWLGEMLVGRDSDPNDVLDFPYQKFGLSLMRLGDAPMQTLFQGVRSERFLNGYSYCNGQLV